MFSLYLFSVVGFAGGCLYCILQGIYLDLTLLFFQVNSQFPKVIYWVICCFIGQFEIQLLPFILLLILWDKVSCSPIWSPTSSVAEDGFEPLILLWSSHDSPLPHAPMPPHAQGECSTLTCSNCLTPYLIIVLHFILFNSTLCLYRSHHSFMKVSISLVELKLSGGLCVCSPAWEGKSILSLF